MENGQKDEPGQQKLTVVRNKAIEIRQLVGGAVADSFDAKKWNAAHFG